MRNLWAQVLEFRGIYLCLGAGWSTTQVWALRRDWGAERRGTTYKFWNLEPPWSRSGALVSVWYTGARPSRCIPLASERTGHTLAKGRAAAVAERESERGSWQQSKGEEKRHHSLGEPTVKGREISTALGPAMRPSLNLSSQAMGSRGRRTRQSCRKPWSNMYITTEPCSSRYLCPCRYPQYLLPSTHV
ncbi:uncharacterized protein CLUP02_17081 [Colletotrichum lupini]|uniref:Uncharacterized protein n=1 Tax=Colletotrichum lupini TaxID=145971 RepID=A0A9Q8T9I7_9PEZI|nr:uncharacterized protein CLUP02_17081 [Colletotrichum lupini]UQC91545.1 hypothetical protein CLUP02_17081 [Colletotrichum lupini]